MSETEQADQAAVSSTPGKKLHFTVWYQLHMRFFFRNSIEETKSCG